MRITRCVSIVNDRDNDDFSGAIKQQILGQIATSLHYTSGGLGAC